MSSDSTWLIVLVVAVIVIALGIAAVMVAVALPLLSRNAADMQGHEQRVKASNGHVIQAIREVFEDARDENRELRHDVEEVLRELRDVRRQLRDRERAERSPATDVERDLARALSNVERVMDRLMRSRPLRIRSLSRSVDEMLRELREVRERLGESGSSVPGETPAQPDASEPGESPPEAAGQADEAESEVVTNGETPPQDSEPR